jgi:hypothetical protein
LVQTFVLKEKKKKSTLLGKVRSNFLRFSLLVYKVPWRKGHLSSCHAFPFLVASRAWEGGGGCKNVLEVVWICNARPIGEIPGARLRVEQEWEVEATVILGGLTGAGGFCGTGWGAIE